MSYIFFFRGNTLKIHTVKKEDRGTYFCVADNGVGKPAKRNIALEVHTVQGVAQ
jgi:neuronal growth regulator 1